MEKSKVLNTSLNFLHVSELREICTKLAILDKGKKDAIILRIVHFLQTGEIIKEPKIPAISLAQRGQNYALQPDALILKGAYKNDLNTRLFFKKLIGDHFHFTAFGQDWIMERWLAGNPPAHQEFADMWQKEYTKRKTIPSIPKAEWAYINFTQKFMQQYPKASHTDIITAWEAERQKHKKIVDQILTTTITRLPLS